MNLVSPIKKNLVNFFSKSRFIGLSLSSSSLDKSFRGIFEVFVFSSSPFGGIFFIDFVDCLQGRTTICRFFNYAS